MRRAAINELDAWFHKKTNRKPLILRGARQVGKSWLVRELAKKNSIQLIEINFEQDPTQKNYFSSNDPKKTFRAICQSFHLGAPDPSRSLLFLDELQAAPEIIGSLRYFYENMPELAVAGAGSLLEFALGEKAFSMPVGRLEIMFLGPMTFEEFLLACSEEGLVEFLNTYKIGDEFYEPMHQKLLELTREFFFVGGMPEAVASYAESKDFLQTERVLRSLAFTYTEDFHKYRKRIPHERFFKLFKKTPALIGHRFKYSLIDPNERAQALSNALDLLCKARVTYKIRNSSGFAIPLSVHSKEKPFKVLFLDCGLVASQLGITLQPNLKLDSILEGGLAEQFIGQHLLYGCKLYHEPELYFWTREEYGTEAEVDYLIQSENGEIIPIEVKAGTSGRLKSLHILMREKKLKTAVRFNSDKPSVFEDGFKLISLPIYLVGQLRRLLL